MDGAIIKLKLLFPSGLSYNESIQLCIMLFSGKYELHPELELSKKELAKLFPDLFHEGFINDYEGNKGNNEQTRQKYAIICSDPSSPAHWTDVCNSIFKIGTDVNDDSIQKIIRSILCKKKDGVSLPK
jgi:hypothetical protein